VLGRSAQDLQPSRQVLDVSSPSNFLLTGPDVLKKTQSEGGQNLQPTILQLGPHIGESSSEVLRIGDVVGSRGSLLADAQLDFHG